MRKMDNVASEEVTKEEVKVVELVEDVDKLLIVANEVILREISWMHHEMQVL